MTLQLCHLGLPLRVSPKIVITGETLHFSPGLVSCVFSTSFIRKFLPGTHGRALSLRRRGAVGYLRVLCFRTQQ